MVTMSGTELPLKRWYNSVMARGERVIAISQFVGEHAAGVYGIGPERLRVIPRGDRARGVQGVFNTRSPDRPNPIGLHRVEVLAVDGIRLHVRDLEALDGTPIIDVKPVLRSIEER